MIMSTQLSVNYLEFSCRNIRAIKDFYKNAFGWTFTDYGPDYAAFNDGKMDGGFYLSDTHVLAGNPLVVLYTEKLEQAQKDVESAGGSISKPIFSFPGGRRFHFKDPDGNELAVWSE